MTEVKSPLSDRMVSPEVAQRQAIELQVVNALLTSALAHGYAVSVDNGGDEFEISDSTNREDILKVMFDTDDEYLHFSLNGKRKGWVWLVYGEDGWDVICDYTTNLDEDVMKPVNELVDKLSEGQPFGYLITLPAPPR